MELNFSHAEMRFKVLGIVTQGLIVKRKCLLVVFLSMFDFAKYIKKVAFKMLNFLSKLDRICILWTGFEFKNVQSSLTELFALLKITPKEQMIRKVFEGECVTRISLNSSIEKLDRFLSGF